jgi:SAM-dependent methyltransferase
MVRIVESSGVPDLTAFLASGTYRQAVDAGRLISTTIVDPTHDRDVLAVGNGGCDGLVLEHPRVWFPSFPHEWPAEMLHAAGALTLELAERLLGEGLGLKDATPQNVLFRGPDPVFVDVLSCERRDPGDPIWLPYAQFIRTFLFPLLVFRFFGMPVHALAAGRRDGLEPEEIYRLCGPLRRLRPPFLALVTLPVWLGARRAATGPSLYRPKRWDNRERARFVLETAFRRLRRALDRLEPGPRGRSRWSGYEEHAQEHTQEHLDTKCDVVDAVLADRRPASVLDVGCNTGLFSALAARRGARVVAIDADPVVAGATWRRARSERLDILPLVVDLTRPTPAVGWRNAECAGFLERARGTFDTVLMLAVLHHLVVSERIPLAEIVALAAELTSDVLLIEFIAPEDPMFRRLARGRDGLFADLTPRAFELACERHFRIIRHVRLGDAHRWVYVMRKR